MARRILVSSTLLIAGALAVAGVAVAAQQQNKYTLKAPGGIAFSEFKGYETWSYVAVSQVENGLKVVAGNPAMIKAYRAGIPENGKRFPDGVKIVKIEWSQKKYDNPYLVMAPDALKSVSVILKDSKRFPDTNGWAYAQFAYDPASDTFKANGTDAKCGYQCHSLVATRDYIFTAYPKR